MVAMNSRADGGAPSVSHAFSLGRLVSTPAAIAAMAKAGKDPVDLLARHRTRDWGDVNAEDKRANDEAIAAGERILSVYTMGDGVKIWIITEADRASTFILLPEDY